MRQETRELVKAYILGLDSAALDDVFELLAWNQGIGYFSSEIGPSTLFAAYKFIKQSEKKDITRDEICNGLREKFGEKNPDINPKFSLLNSPIGKVMIGKVTISDMSQRSGMDMNSLIDGIRKLIEEETLST